MSDLSLAITGGDAVGVVGESGSEKTTLLQAIAGLHPSRAGTIRFLFRLFRHDISHREEARTDVSVQATGVELINRTDSAVWPLVAGGYHSATPTLATVDVNLYGGSPRRFPYRRLAGCIDGCSHSVG